MTTFRTFGSQRSTATLLLVFALLCPLLMCVWKLVIDSLFGLLAVAIFVLEHGVDALNGDPTDFLRSDILGLSFYVSIGGLVGLTWLFSWFMKWPTKSAFGFVKVHWIVLVLSLCIGCVVGVFPGWVAHQLSELFPSLVNNSALELVEKMLLEGPLFGRLISISAICVGAPILEELLFRGFLWTLFERTGNALFRGNLTTPEPSVAPMIGGYIAFVLTSFGFAAFHMDPIQSTALLFTAFALGFVRLLSGSIWPCILIHFVNNTLAASIALSGQSELTLGILTSIAGAILTALFILACYPKRSWRSR